MASSGVRWSADTPASPKHLPQFPGNCPISTGDCYRSRFMRNWISLSHCRKWPAGLTSALTISQDCSGPRLAAPLPICTGTTAHPGTRSSATINHQNHRRRSRLRLQRRQPVQQGFQGQIWRDTIPLPKRGSLIKEPLNHQQRFGITCQR